MRPVLWTASLALTLSLPTGSLAGVQDEDQDRRSWTLPSVPQGGTLEIRLRTGAGLSITAWDRDEVAVTSDWSQARCRDAEIDVSRTASGVLIESRYPAGHAWVNHHCSFGIEVKVPRRFDIRVRSAGGSVAIAGMHGDVQGHTGGGAIELSGLRGSIQLRTGGGAIIVRDSRLEGRLTTGGGHVRFENVSGGVTARSGSVRGIVRAGTYSI